jgi:hypothetical protein
MQLAKSTGGQYPHADDSPREDPAESTQITLIPRIKPPRPTRRSSQRYMRQRLIADLPIIADALLLAARCGGVPELKALIQLSGLDEKRAIPRNSKPRGRSFADILMDNWRKEPLDEDASVGAAGPDG